MASQGHTQTKMLTNNGNGNYNGPSCSSQKFLFPVQNVTNTTDSAEIVVLIKDIENIVENANSEETAQIAGSVISVMDTLSTYTPAEENTTNETVAVRQNYRKVS